MSKRTPYVPPPKKDPWVITTFVPEVTKDEQSPAHKIFHDMYLCRIANIHTESVEAMRKRQVRGNEYGATGMAYAQALRPVYLTISGMTELMMEGATIYLDDVKAPKEIYDIVKAHLKSWCRHVDLSINRQEIPEEDLRALDMFAAVIYPHARPEIENNGSDNLINQLFGRGGQSRLFRRHDPERQKVIDAEATGYVETPLQHQSMMDVLANPPDMMDKVKSKWT